MCDEDREQRFGEICEREFVFASVPYFPNNMDEYLEKENGNESHAN